MTSASLRRTVTACTVVALALLTIPALAAAADRYVSPTGADAANSCTTQASPCLTIGHAVDASGTGDTINLAAGTYVESVTPAHRVVFVGPNAGWTPGTPLQTPAIWRGVGDDPALTISVTLIFVNGISFGTPGGGAPPTDTEGIRINGADGSWVRSSVFAHLDRGVVAHFTDNALIETSSFEGNATGIDANDDAVSELRNNAFSANTTAVALTRSYQARITGSVSSGDATFLEMDHTAKGTVTNNRVSGATADAIRLHADYILDVSDNQLRGAADGIRFVGPSPAMDIRVQRNDLAGLGHSSLFFEAGSVEASSQTIDANRFYDTGDTAVRAEGGLGTIHAENNWWGCNAGPLFAPCDSAAADAGTTIVTSPWTVMALHADPTSVPIGGADSSQMTADFNTNSAGDPISEQGLPDTGPVTFATTLGTIEHDACACAGEAEAELTPDNTPGTAHVSATFDAQTVTTDVQFTSLLTVDPTSADFGNRGIGNATPPQRFTVTNPQSSAMRIAAVRLIGTDASDFRRVAQECIGATLEPHANCPMSVAFNPRTLGQKSATLEIVTAGERIDIPLTGTGTTTTPLVFDPTSWDFGEQVVGSTAPTTSITVTNSSAAAQTITHVELEGDDPSSFVRYGGACLNRTLAPAGGSCTISATFRPTSAGAKSALIIVMMATSPVQVIPLSGTGVTGSPLTITPSAWDFGNRPVNNASPTKSFVVTNTSATSTVGVLNVALAGTNTADFVAFVGGCARKILAPGASCTVSARFRPLSAGAKTAQLKVTWSGGPTQFIDLSGQGFG